MKNGLIKWDHEEVPDQEIRRRIETVRKTMDEKQLDAILLFGDVNEAGAVSYFSNLSPYYFSTVLVLPRVGEGMMTTAMAQRSKSWIQSNSLIQDIRFQRDYGKGCSEVLKEIGLKYNKVGIVEFDLFPYTAFLNLKKEFPDVEFVDVTEIANEMRMERSPVEINLVRHAGQIACESLEHVIKNWHFQKECELAAEIERQARYRRCEDVFVHIASNADKVRWLHLPTDRKLEKEIIVEVMVQYSNYWANIGRCIIPKHLDKSLLYLKDKAELIYTKTANNLKARGKVKDIFEEIRTENDHAIKIFSNIGFGIYMESMQRLWINSDGPRNYENIKFRENMEVIFQIGLLDTVNYNKYLIQNTFIIGKTQANNLTEMPFALIHNIP